MGQPDDDRDFSGIDPQKLWDLINSIKSRTGSDGGNPQQYAKEYCGGHAFLTSQGTLVGGASAQQRQAYNAWLTDQKVAQASDERFRQLDVGRLDGTLGGS